MTAKHKNTVTVRQYRDTDFPGVAALETDGVHEPYRSAVFVRQQAAVSPETFLVAIQKEKVVGFVAAAIVHDNPACAWILRVMVGDGFRRCGIGTALLRGAVRVLGGCGVTEIYLTVSPKNEPAVRLYTQEGFVKESLVAAYFGNGEDRFVMKRESETCPEK